MNNFRSRFRSTSGKLALGALLLLIQGSLLANHLNLRPFSAKYEVYRNDQHVANAYFSLDFKNGVWTWRMNTRPKGLFKWLTQKKPFTNTHMAKSSEGYRLSKISNGDYREKPPKDNTFFDQANGVIYYSDSTSEPRQLALPEDLHSYHTVHLLYQQMKDSGHAQRDIKFYKRGRVYESRLTLDSGIRLAHHSGTLTVDRITQQVRNSDKKMVYYYQGHSLAPLKIEQYEQGEANSVMWRSEITVDDSNSQVTATSLLSEPKKTSSQPE